MSTKLKIGMIIPSFRPIVGGAERQLEGLLEKNLRNLKTRQRTINLLANEIVQAFLNGII